MLCPKACSNQYLKIVKHSEVFKMETGFGFVGELTANKGPNERLREMIQLLLNASADFDFSFNEEKTISSVLKVHIRSIVDDKGADVNVTVDVNGVRHNVLSVVLNNLFPAHPETGDLSCWLLYHGASIELTHPSALLKAIIVNNANLVRKLIHSGMMPVDLPVPKFGTLSPLNVALIMKQDTLASYFVKYSFLTDADKISYFRNHSSIIPPSLLELCVHRCSVSIGIQDRESKITSPSLKIPNPLIDKIKNALEEIVLHSEEVDAEIEENLLIAIYRESPFSIWRNQINSN